METKRWYLAVPFGDPAGIGPEIVLKAMQRVNLPPSMGMVVIGEMPLLKKVSTDLGIPSDFDAVAVDEAPWFVQSKAVAVIFSTPKISWICIDSTMVRSRQCVAKLHTMQ